MRPKLGMLVALLVESYLKKKTFLPKTVTLPFSISKIWFTMLWKVHAGSAMAIFRPHGAHPRIKRAYQYQYPRPEMGPSKRKCVNTWAAPSRYLWEGAHSTRGPFNNELHPLRRSLDCAAGCRVKSHCRRLSCKLLRIADWGSVEDQWPISHHIMRGVRATEGVAF